MSEKLSIQVNKDLLQALRVLSEASGVSVDSLVGEALGELLVKRQRSKLMEHYQHSVAKFGPLYERLAE